MALILGVAVFFLNGLLLTSASAATSFTTAIVVGVCWYVYKLFDGLEYDGTEITGGTLIGLIAALVICSSYFLI